MTATPAILTRLPAALSPRRTAANKILQGPIRYADPLIRQWFLEALSSIRVVPAVSVKGLVKRYGEATALAGIDLSIKAGEVFALLGPNGAGKTTTVEILEGYRSADEGTVRVLGFEPRSGGREYRERIGIVLQDESVERELSVEEAIETFGSVYPRRLPTADLIEMVGLTEKADARIKTLSGGQRRRLELALGLVGDPELVFLDEPTTGFDPSARRQAWETLRNLRSLGKTILLTTHYMDEAQQLADRIAVINDGRIVAEGAPDTLGRRSSALVTISFVLPEGVGAESLPVSGFNVLDGGMVQLETSTLTRTLHQLTSWAIDVGIELDLLHISRPSLEDVYLELMDENEDA